MDTLPRLQTAQLWLRPVDLGDAAAISRLAGEREVAAVTRSIPHPYPEPLALDWIRAQRDALERAEHFCFAISAKPELRLIGVCSLRLNCCHDLPALEGRFRPAELGYWIGRPFWGRGYAGEAARAVVDFGFRRLGLHRVYARCYADNAASLRVLEKTGLRREGCLRRHHVRFGLVKDVCLYGLLHEEWQRGLSPQGTVPDAAKSAAAGDSPLRGQSPVPGSVPVSPSRRGRA